ncbi:B3 domain-containing protein At4g01580, partial [Linum perenne]
NSEIRSAEDHHNKRAPFSLAPSIEQFSVSALTETPTSIFLLSSSYFTQQIKPIILIYSFLETKALLFTSQQRKNQKKKKKKKNMASSSNARHGGNCFFKTITTLNILKNQLRIPKMIGNQLQVHDCVTLEVPTGDEWEVQLERDSRGVVSFCNDGWRRFTKFYSIISGNFLHFEYKGCSDFLVFIYETAPTEIDYPLRNDGQDSSVQTEPADSLAMVVCHVPLNTMDEEEEGMDSNDDDDDVETPFSSEHPFFKIKIRRSYLHIPQAVSLFNHTKKIYFLELYGFDKLFCECAAYTCKIYE